MDEFSAIHLWNHNRQDKALQNLLGVRVGIGDDASVIAIEEQINQFELLYTVDTMVEDIHFNASTMSLQQIGYKALVTNISDIAAMGGIPLHALVAISVPSTYDEQHIKAIYDGIYQCANQYQLAIVGGNTTSAPHSLTISITLIGKVEQGKALLRSGAETDDVVFVTGVAGQSAAGLDVLLKGISIEGRPELQSLVQAHQQPFPHLTAGRLLIQSGICHALNDVSDGLASELSEIAIASSVDIVIEEQLLPISEHMSQYASSSQQRMLDWILYGGEDYVLVGTASEKEFAILEDSFQRHQLPLFRIGYTQAGTGTGTVHLERWNYQFSTKERTVIQNRGFNHFRK